MDEPTLSVPAAELSDQLADEAHMTDTEWDRMYDEALRLARQEQSRHIHSSHVRRAFRWWQQQREK